MAFNPIVIEKGLNAGFAREMAQFQAAREISPGIMAAGMMIPSTAAYEKLGWLGAMPTVQQWLGEIQAKQLEDYDYTIKNKDWAVAVPVNENDVADDQTGVHTMFPAMLAQRMRHPENLMIDLLIDGDSETAYDGVAFFSDVSGARTIDNLLAGTGTDLDEVEADLNAALVAMAKFTDDQGEALNLRGDLIVCPVAMERSTCAAILSFAPWRWRTLSAALCSPPVTRPLPVVSRRLTPMRGVLPLSEIRDLTRMTRMPRRRSSSRLFFPCGSPPKTVSRKRTVRSRGSGPLTTVATPVMAFRTSRSRRSTNLTAGAPAPASFEAIMKVQFENGYEAEMRDEVAKIYTKWQRSTSRKARSSR